MNINTFMKKEKPRTLMISMIMTLLFLYAVVFTGDSTMPVFGQQNVGETSCLQITQSSDPEADKINLTSTDLNVRSGPGLNHAVIGVLDSNVSVTILWIEENEWGYCKEYQGYVNTRFLKRVPLEKIIGVIHMRNDIKPYLVNLPIANEEVEYIENSTVYSTHPTMYDEKYYKVDGDKYIDRGLISVDYYEEEYYKRYKQSDISRSKTNVYSTGYARVINTNPQSVSNLNINEIKSMVKNTPLDGIEESVKYIEDQYGVNAVYTVSVAMLESGYGKSYLARNQNNIFGLDPYNGGMTFDSKSDCVKYFGRLTKKYYFDKGNRDLASINSVYEPYNDDWQHLVKSIMSDNIRKIERLI